MASNNIARLGVVLGLDTAEFTASIDKAISENTKLKRAIQRDSNAAAKEIVSLKFATDDYGKTLSKVEAVEREMASGRYKNASIDLQTKLRAQAAAYDAVAAAADKAAQSEKIAADIQSINHATEDYGKTLSRVQTIEREIATGKYRTASPEQRQALLHAAAAYDAVAGSVKKVNAGLTDQQKMGISYQITDFVTQVGSGQSAMVALMQQGGQLKDQLGGFGNAFRLLSAAITPAMVGIASVATGVGILGFAFYKGAQESDALRDSMILTGRYAGITQSGFQQLAESLSGSLNYSIGNTKDILSALVSSGKFTSDSLGSVGQSIALVAKLSGQSASEVAQKLIPSFNGTASSAKSMNDQYHFLTLAQYKQIEALEKQGRAQEAIKVQADAFNASVKDQTRNLGIIEQSWNALGNAISRAWDFLKGIGRTDGPEVKLANTVALLNAAEQQLAKLDKQRGGAEKSRSQILTEKAIAEYTAEKEILTAELVAINTKTETAKKETEKVNKYEKAGGLAAQLKLQDEINKLAFANKIEFAKQEATEIESIQLDSQRKIEEARNEMLQANRDQNNAFAPLQLKIYTEKAIAIAAEGAKKVKDIWSRANQDAAQADLDYLEEVAGFMSSRQTAFDSAMMSQVKSIELENLSLEFAGKRLAAQDGLRFAAEKEVKLSNLRLETEEKIARIKLDKTLNEAGKQTVIDQIQQQVKVKESLIETEDRYKKVGEMWDSVTNNMTNALDNFVKTGKLNFKDFARSVIQDLIAIQLKAQATSLLRMAIGSITGATTGSTYNPSGGIAEHVFNPNRAEGGPVDEGKIGLVGERGPELFVPRTAGTIIPNHALAGMGGSTTNVVNNYIQAIDTQSFEQRLLGSSRAVWAANAYAAKGLASTMGRA
jgi:phage-related minor tail protein